LTDLGPVFSKALAKAPEDRYDTCVEFVDDLAMQLQSVAADTGATDATAVSRAALGQGLQHGHGMPSANLRRRIIGKSQSRCWWRYCWPSSLSR
jgi:hypothetical protein